MNRFSLICFLIVVAAVGLLFHPLARGAMQDREQSVRPRPSSGPLTGKRIALLIGNGEYAEAALRNPPNDAAGIAKALRDLGFDVIELTNQNKAQMKQALRVFGDKLASGEGNIGLFFFAGHGIQVSGRNYLIPVGADVSNEAEAEDECVNLELVLAQLTRSRKGLNIIILDACRNNPFRGWRSPEGGLAFVNAPRGTLIAYATAPGRTAADGRGKNSPYTTALLNHLRTPNIHLLKMFENVRAEVDLNTNGSQTPWESTSVTNGSEFYLAGKTNDNRPSDPRAQELEYWNSIKASRNAADFRTYLAQYPNGEFKTTAENRIIEIERAPRLHSPRPAGMVWLEVAVSDQNNLPLINLEKDDFIVHEDGVRQQIDSLSREEAPTSFGLVIDTSGSMLINLPTVKEAAVSLIRQMRKEDEAFVAEFKDAGELVQGFTANISDLEEAIDSLFISGRSAILESTVATADYALEKAKHRRKVLIVFTDGMEIHSPAKEQLAIEAIKVDEVQIHLVCITDKEKVKVAAMQSKVSPNKIEETQKVLSRLAQESGGRAYFIEHLSQTPTIAAQIAKDIYTQYVIGYRPTRTECDGKFRTMRVAVNTKGNL